MSTSVVSTISVYLQATNYAGVLGCPHAGNRSPLLLRLSKSVAAVVDNG